MDMTGAPGRGPIPAARSASVSRSYRRAREGKVFLKCRGSQQVRRDGRASPDGSEVRRILGGAWRREQRSGEPGARRDHDGFMRTVRSRRWREGRQHGVVDGTRGGRSRAGLGNRSFMPIVSDLGAALLHRRFPPLFTGVFRSRALPLRCGLRGGQRTGQRPRPVVYGPPARPDPGGGTASVCPLRRAPLDIRAAFGTVSLGRETPVDGRGGRRRSRDVRSA